MFPRSMLTNDRMLVHSRLSSMLQSMQNPWELEADDPMHTDSLATATETAHLVNELRILMNLADKLTLQMERSLILLTPGEINCIADAKRRSSSDLIINV